MVRHGVTWILAIVDPIAHICAKTLSFLLEIISLRRTEHLFYHKLVGCSLAKKGIAAKTYKHV